MIMLVLSLALVGFIVWIIITKIPMPEIIKQAIVVIVVVFMIIYLMRILGISDIPIPSFK